MIGNVCPNKTSPYYLKALEAVNNDEQALYRLFVNFNATNPGEELEKIIEFADADKVPVSHKKEKLAKRAALVEKVDDPIAKTHSYLYNGNEVQSMSRAMDQIPDIAYNGPTAKEGYAETGTAIHKAFELIALSSRTPATRELLIKKFTEEMNLPADTYDKLLELYNNLVGTDAVLLVEQKLVSDANGVSKVAGTSDIFRFYPKSGKYEILDLKTAYRTPGNLGAIWNPSKGSNFKKKRYTTQLLGYGRMAEMVLQQTPSDYFIVPIEVETADLKHDGQIQKFNVLKPESIKSYGYMRNATLHLDKIFKQESFETTLVGNTEFDNVFGNAYTTLTGDISGDSTSPEDMAYVIWRNRKRSKSTGAMGYYSGSKHIPFISNDEKSQIQQIIDEYVSNQTKTNTDLEYAVMNYLADGTESHIQYLGNNPAKLKNFLKNFVKRPNVEVKSLSNVPGMQDKKNWLLIKEKFENSSITHLLYVGADNLSTKFITKSGINSSVFGKEIGFADSYSEIGSSLKNNLGDARAFEATMIAMKLKNDNPDISFGLVNIFGLGGNGLGRVVDLKENLRTVSRVKDHSILRDKLFNTEFLRMVSSNPKLLDYKQYQGSWLDSLIHNSLASGNLDRGTLMPKLGKYAKDASAKKELVEELRANIINKVEMGLDAETDYNTFLMSMLYLQLTEVDVSLIPENILSSHAGVPSLVVNPMLQEVNKILQTSQTEMIREFWDDYKTDYKKQIAKFLKSKSIGSQTEDYFSGDTPRHYQNLFLKVKKKIKTPDGDKEIDAITFELKPEDSPEFKALSDEEQSFIKKTNDVMEKAAKRSGIEWRRGKLPLVRGSNANKFYNALRDGGVKQYTQVINNYLTDLDASYGMGEDSEPSLDNIFAHQEDDKRRFEEMLGFQKDGYLNYSQYSEYSTNIEQMMDVFVIQSLKYKHLNEIAGMMRATKSIFDWYKSNIVGDRLDTNREFLNWFHTVNIVGRDIDSKDDFAGKANRIMRSVNRAAGLTYIAADPITAASSLVGNELTLLSQSIANKVSSSTGISPATYLESKGIITKSLSGKFAGSKDFDKINLLMGQMRLFNQDMTQLLSGYHREGDKFLFRSKWLFSLMNMADWESRASLMISTMLEDGSWNAYSVNEDGDLVYDETKDKRFNGSGKLTAEQSRALRTAIAEKTGVAPGANLNSGYTVEMGNSVRTMANYLFGGYDKETKSMFNFKWWGKMFISQKNWLPAKIQRWSLGKMESKLMGHWNYETDENGDLKAVWEGDQMEGIVSSFIATYNYLNKRAKGLETTPLTKIQKQNVVRAISDFAVVGLSMLMYMALPDDDDDTKWDDVSAEVIRRGTDDLLAVVNALSLDDYLWTPIPLKFANSAIDTIVKVGTGGVPISTLAEITPGASSIMDTIEKFEDDEE